MAFQKITNARPPRRWALIAPALAGKSTFAVQMRAPLLMIDPDHRAEAVVHEAPDPEQVMAMDRSAVNTVGTIVSELEKNMPKSGIRTIIVDSLTAILEPLVTDAMITNAEARNGSSRGNQSSTFLEKALAMRQLQDAICRYGTDVLFIWHKEFGQFNGGETERETVSETERERLKRNLNALLYVVQGNDGRRGIAVENLRPRPGQAVTTTIWDDSGRWAGMPDKIDDFLNATAPLQNPRPLIRSKEDAILAAVSTGAYKTAALAEEAYAKLKAEKKPASAAAMFELWHEHLAVLTPAKAA